MGHGLGMVDVDISLPELFGLSANVLFGAVVFLSFLLASGLSYLKLSTVFASLTSGASSIDNQKVYQDVVAPYQGWLNWVIVLSGVDLIILAIPASARLKLLEFPLGGLIALNVSFLGFNLLKELFDVYLLSAALDNEQKINTELLVLAKFVFNAVLVLIVVFIFAQTHQINVLGLIASLGVGGVAIAFASQKVLEQILWSIVLYIDRPFIVDDYIHLSDNIIGRVESVGWRSTKIRLSGKNTLVIVPNSQLAQTSIENMTRARRVISIVNLTFFKAMSDEEKSLVHQLVLESTRDILGIDHRLTQITFEALTDVSGQAYVKTRVLFYILGAAESSMELRRNLLEIAKENIIDRLQNYGMDFNFEEEALDIAQPMNI